MSKSINPEALRVSQAIKCMDTLIEQGWRYDWRINQDSFYKVCCLYGAANQCGRGDLLHGGLLGEQSLSSIAFKAHGKQLEGRRAAPTEYYVLSAPAYEVPYDDWETIKANLLKQYDLADVHAHM